MTKVSVTLYLLGSVGVIDGKFPSNLTIGDLAQKSNLTRARLTHSDKETGFFPKSANHNEIFSQKPGFWPPARP